MYVISCFGDTLNSGEVLVKPFSKQLSTWGGYDERDIEWPGVRGVNGVRAVFKVVLAKDCAAVVLPPLSRAV